MDDEERRAWWPQMRRLDSTPGGTFEERWSDGDGEVLTSGQVTAAAEPGLLALSWADDGWPTSTAVRIELTPAGAETEARIIHTGWARLSGGAELARAHEAGWRSHLRRWRGHLERTGA